MTRIIDRDVIELINADRFRNLLREHGLYVSGSKDELIHRINTAVTDGEMSLDSINEFLALEISHGRNRAIFISSYPRHYTRQLKDLRFVQSNLAIKNYKFDNFNDIRNTTRPEEVTLVYLNIKVDNSEVEKISMCFAKTIVTSGLKDEDGDELPPRYETDYIWVDILINEEKILIKIKPKSNIYDQEVRAKKTFKEISEIITDIFNFKQEYNDGQAKQTLYKMFRDLTQTAEAPYRERVEPLLEEIEHFSKICASKIDLPSEKEPVDLPKRIFRLLERAIIQQEFHIYQSYFNGKKGVVDRIHFADLTGARVNARSGHGSDGIAMTDIYFDTKDTVDSLGKFDKLWVTWFYKENDEVERPTSIPTKFEVFNDHYVIHFLHAYTTKELVEHVLSRFKYYEELPD